MKPSRRRQLSATATVALALGLLLFASTASHAVIIYFKDGSKEMIADSFRIEGNRLIAVLTSGQETARCRSTRSISRRPRRWASWRRASAIVIDRGEAEQGALRQARGVADLMRERSTLPTPVPLAREHLAHAALHTLRQRRLHQLAAAPALAARARRAGRVAACQSRPG